MGAVRPYQPVTPANNQYLARRWDHEIFNTHRKKVAAAKATIDNDPPRVHMHLHIKLKKLQFEAERLATIERDNRILLEKMAHIMRSGGVVDNKKWDYHLKSLNKIKRQRELLRITHENLAILKRLTTKDPHYNHKKWNLQWHINQHYLMNISKFQHPWRQEQSPYQSMAERQSMANKFINQKILSANKGYRSVGGTQKSVLKPERNAINVKESKVTISAKPYDKTTSTKAATLTKTAATKVKPKNEEVVTPDDACAITPAVTIKETPAVAIEVTPGVTIEATSATEIDNKEKSKVEEVVTPDNACEVTPAVTIKETPNLENEASPAVTIEVTSETEIEETQPESTEVTSAKETDMIPSYEAPGEVIVDSEK